ncbi:MAG TPA: YafY family protein [Thermomicrobiales bacterium]|nr:YafY family protein [Thermomicrobiales bacterium]
MVIEATRPASRILAMLELLQDRPGLSGPQLANALGVTTRTIRRYVTTLQDMGIPVEPTAGRIGGYWLRPGYRMPPLMFSSDEAIGLAVTLLTARVSSEEQLPAPVANALAKIERSLPQDLAKRIATIRDGFRMARDPWPDANAFPNPEVLAVVIQASLAKQRLWIRYGNYDGDQTSRDVDPWGVLFLDGRWYLHGWCLLRTGPRTFRIDRIRRVDMLQDDACAPPDGFDIEEAVLRSIAMTRAGGDFDLRIEATAAEVRRYLPPQMAIVEDLPEGGVRAWGTTDNIHWLAPRLGALPFRFSVVGPEPLKDELRKIGERLQQAAGLH